MGQWEVYEAIQSLGGRATFVQIRKYMRNKYLLCPDSSAQIALRKLVRNSLVASAPISRPTSRRMYRIAAKFLERNVIIIAKDVSRSLTA